ncbi:MAG: thioredoxin family protein [Acidimicrobiia bacterium]
MANLKLGDRAIPFELPGVDGAVHSFSDYDDKHILVVIFSCNHCPYVKAWEDRMIQIQADYKEKGVQLIAINSNDDTKYPEDNFESMKERAATKGFNFPYLRDESQEVARAYGAERTPEVFVFDRDRLLRYHGAIDDNYDDPAAVESHYLRNALDALLQGNLPRIQETEPVGCTVKWR